VRDADGRVTAAINITGPAARWTLARMELVAAALVNEAEIVSRLLGYVAPSSRGSPASARRKRP
jgi:DNA-binding IclR family transcriptional regulator